MTSTSREMSVPVADGAVPIHVAAPADASSSPGVVVIPSIFGAADDLLAQMASLADQAAIAVMDPFWREGGGALPYADKPAAFARLESFDRDRCRSDVEAVANWVRGETNGNIVALGICFGGPFALLAAHAGVASAAVTWHGSRMEGVLDQLGGMTAPLRLHFGSVDPITPPEVIEAIGAAFADHPDCKMVIHEGADHGFSHEGPAWDETAAAAGIADLQALLTTLSS